MRRASWLILLGLGVLALGVRPGGPPAQAEDKKGAMVELAGMQSQAPAAWKEEEPTSTMRFMQFRLPHVEGDKTDAELVIFKNFGGSAKDNIKRWKGQFIPPEGKKIDDVSTVSDMDVGKAHLAYLDIHGTYLFKAKPIDPDSKAEKRPDYRMLAVQFNGPKEAVYHIKLVGPAKTVAHYKKGFDDWLKAFK